jgi:hypothetical protein
VKAVLEYTPLPGSTDNEGVKVYGDHRNITGSATRGSSSSCRSHRVILYVKDESARFSSQEDNDHTYLRYISTNVQHRDTSKGCAPKQALSASDFLDDVEGKCAHAKSLRNTVEAGGEKLG